MKNTVATQYDIFHDAYSQNQAEQDESSNLVFYKAIDFDLKDKKLLDVGCGNGADLKILSKTGAEIYGIDPSQEFINEAKANNPQGNLVVGVGEDLPFENSQFDVVVSKWAIQTSVDVPKVMREIARVLKPGGTMLILTKHPLRQWTEKVRDLGHGSNYYQQDIVTSNIFDGMIQLKEPSHTMSEYFNGDLFNNFVINEYIEGSDFPASEQINGDIYPTYFLLKATKKGAR